MTVKTTIRAAMALSFCAGSAWSSLSWGGTVANELTDEQASAGVINAGNAIQGLCGAMKNAGYGPTVTGPATTPAGASAASGNLYLRCNEIVQTANALTGVNASARALGFGSLASTVQQINGEEVNAQGALALRVPSGQFTNLGARLNTLRYGSLSSLGHITADNDESDSDAPLLADRGALRRALIADELYSDWRIRPVNYAPSSGDASTSSDIQSDKYHPEVDSPFGVFTEGTYGWGHRDETTNEDAFRFHSYSVTVGTDYSFAHGAVGASVGFDRYRASFNAAGGSADTPESVVGGDARVDGYSGSLFALWYYGNFSVNEIVTLGHLKAESTRVVDYTGLNGTTCFNCGTSGAAALRGDPDGHFAAGGITAQYDLTLAGILISPSVSANYRRATLESYTEQDPAASGLALRYSEQNIESLRSIVAVNFAHSFSSSFGVLTPNLKAEWHHEFRDQPNNVIMNYATSVVNVNTSAYSFVSPSDKPESNFGIVGLGVSSKFAHQVQAYMYYERLVGVSYLKDNALTVGVRAQF